MEENQEIIIPKIVVSFSPNPYIKGIKNNTGCTSVLFSLYQLSCSICNADAEAIHFH